MCPQSFSYTPHHTADLQQEGLAREQRDGGKDAANPAVLMLPISGRRVLFAEGLSVNRRVPNHILLFYKRSMLIDVAR